MYKISPNIHKGRVLLTNIDISEIGYDSFRKPLNASSPDSSKMVHPNDPRRPRLTWWQRLRQLLYVYESPLNLRGSLIRSSLFVSFCHYQHGTFRVPDPVPPKTMLNKIWLLYSRLISADLTNMQTIPIWRARDTPLRSLYRIAREHYAVGPEVEHFWYQVRRPWELHGMPDPSDRDPIQYAILACIAEELVKTFNWRLSLPS